ncbi:unnamed protein product [Mucor hiemalis]
MQQEIYPNQDFLQAPRRRYLICGFMDLSYGGPFVCFLWIVINMYVCVLSFQGRSPIYSHLNRIALIIQGVVCLFFVISALMSLYSFTLNMPKQLRRSHRSTWVMVIIFLIVYFANMIVFCVQTTPFLDWCLSKSRSSTLNTLANLPNNSTVFTSNNITSFNSSTVTSYQSIISGSDLYNCTRLREDEIKLSIVVFVILFTIYVHFAFCFWCYTQDRLKLQQQFYEAMESQNYGNMMNNNPNMMMGNNPNMMMGNNPNMMMGNNPNMMMNNIKPNNAKEGVEYDEKEQKSLAQLTRAVFGRLRR